jgi:hypothetical protein
MTDQHDAANARELDQQHEQPSHKSIKLTLPMFRQLDEVFYCDCKPLARVDDGSDDELVVGYDRDTGALVRAEFESSWSEGASPEHYHADLEAFHELPLIALENYGPLRAPPEPYTPSTPKTPNDQLELDL